MTMRPDVNRESTGLPLAALMPGLAVALAMAAIAISGQAGRLFGLVSLSPILFVSIPWVTLLVLRRPAADLGYTRQRAVVRFGWGLLAGALWRGASLALNLAWSAPPGGLGATLGDWLGGVVWIPFVEETFFRGYLLLGLLPRCGVLGAVAVQAVLFAAHPIHWAQGMPHLVSILGFGLLAGFLVARTRSIWPAWGAHALANMLPHWMG